MADGSAAGDSWGGNEESTKSTMRWEPEEGFFLVFSDLFGCRVGVVEFLHLVWKVDD